MRQVNICLLKNIKGAIINLNLIKLKKEADYSEYPDLKPNEQTKWLGCLSYLYQGNGTLFKGKRWRNFIYWKGDQFLIGPESEYWDLCLLIKQKVLMIFSVSKKK